MRSHLSHNSLPWKPHEVWQLSGRSGPTTSPARIQIVTERWNTVAAVPFIVTLPEKNRILMLLTCGYPHRPMLIESDDGGATWSAPRYFRKGDPGDGASHAIGAFVTFLGDGRLMLSAGDGERWSSANSGQTWEGPIALEKAPGGIPWYQWDPYLVDRDPKTGQVARVAETGQTATMHTPSGGRWQAFIRFSSGGGRAWSGAIVSGARTPAITSSRPGLTTKQRLHCCPRRRLMPGRPMASRVPSFSFAHSPEGILITRSPSCTTTRRCRSTAGSRIRSGGCTSTARTRRTFAPRLIRSCTSASSSTLGISPRPPTASTTSGPRRHGISTSPVTSGTTATSHWIFRWCGTCCGHALRRARCWSWIRNSARLGAKCQKLWEYPTEDAPSGEVFTPHPGSTAFRVVHVPGSMYNWPLATTMVFPGDDIGLDSPSGLRETALRTLAPLRYNGDEQLLTSVMRARLGVDDMEGFERQLARTARPNGTLSYRWLDASGRDCGGQSFFWVHGAGNSLWHNENLMQSYNGKIRIAPVKLETAARFANLRAVGAFLVSAEIMPGGEVSYITITSEAGRACRLSRPWEGETRVRALPSMELVSFTAASDSITFATSKAAVYVVDRPSRPWEQQTVSHLPGAAIE